jgi:choline dehydrogenase
MDGIQLHKLHHMCSAVTDLTWPHHFCRMGLPGDPGAVVSPHDLSLHCVSGVRVIDASVMPKIPGGQTGAPVVMIAERAAAALTQQQAITGSSPKTLTASA